MKHILTVQVMNRPGVLTRVAGLFARRGYNIDSLAVGKTDNPEVSRMTIVVDGDENVIEQVGKQLYKLIDVIKLTDITTEEYVDRELVIIKVCCDTNQRAEIMQIVDIFRGRIVDIGRDALMIEVTGDSGKVEAAISNLKSFGIREVVRTGKIAMIRSGNKK
ncbi:MAG: acetolactate synthase small subunit [Clostridia bacterium]